jgi:hypothetical protein
VNVPGVRSDLRVIDKLESCWAMVRGRTCWLHFGARSSAQHPDEASSTLHAHHTADDHACTSRRSSERRAKPNKPSWKSGWCKGLS